LKTGKPVQRRTGRPAPKVRPERSGRLHAELLLVGRDLLRGRVTEANAQQLAGSLARRGALVHRITVVDDTEQAVARAVREALERNPHLLITTGGLGPAPDDRTLVAVSTVLGRPLTLNHQARAMVESAYQRQREAGLVKRDGLNLAREKMCKIPVGSLPVPNDKGVAPGVVCRLPGGAAVVCLPGTPREARSVLEQALQLLKELVPHGRTMLREIEAPTADESELPPLLERLTQEYPNIWISSRPVGSGRRGSKVVVMLEASAATEAEAEQIIENATGRLLALAAGSF
jgi:molybdopterin-biosynthesis enzyme MoeA-like protein